LDAGAADQTHDRPIPPQIGGLRTRLRESSRFRAGFGDRPPQARARRAQPRRIPRRPQLPL